MAKSARMADRAANDSERAPIAAIGSRSRWQLPFSAASRSRLSHPSAELSHGARKNATHEHAADGVGVRSRMCYTRGARGVSLGSCRGNQTDRDSPYDDAITLAAGRHSRGYWTRCWLVTGPRPPFEIRTGSLLPSRGESVGLHVSSGAWLAADGMVGRRARLRTHPRRSDHPRRVSPH
jgi:hypothetical protein